MRPWATRRLSTRGTLKRSGVALGQVLELLERLVEAVDVRLPERREEAAARIEPGAGHHPEVDLADRADALLEQQAGLDERLERELLDDVVDVGLGVARQVGSPFA